MITFISRNCILLFAIYGLFVSCTSQKTIGLIADVNKQVESLSTRVDSLEGVLNQQGITINSHSVKIDENARNISNISNAANRTSNCSDIENAINNLPLGAGAVINGNEIIYQSLPSSVNFARFMRRAGVVKIMIHGTNDPRITGVKVFHSRGGFNLLTNTAYIFDAFSSKNSCSWSNVDMTDPKAKIKFDVPDNYTISVWAIKKRWTRTD